MRAIPKQKAGLAKATYNVTIHFDVLQELVEVVKDHLENSGMGKGKQGVLIDTEPYAPFHFEVIMERMGVEQPYQITEDNVDDYDRVGYVVNAELKHF